MNNGYQPKEVSLHEQELWKSFQYGDDKALSTIYSLYFDALYNYGAKFTCDNSLIEDCIQDLFIKLMRNRQQLSTPNSVQYYLFKAFRSFIYDRLEQTRRHTPSELKDTMEFHLALSRESEIIHGEEQIERYQKLQTALLRLTARQREAIYLKYEAGFSYPEISEMLSLTQKATYKLIGRAIHVLRTGDISIILCFIGIMISEKIFLVMG